MKKITLVNVNIGFERGIMPLGLCSISAYLKMYGGFVDITLLDSNCQDIFCSFVPSDIVGISAVSQTIEQAITFAEHVRSVCDATIILGGVHISTNPVLPSAFDFGVIGEGEETMLELVSLPELSNETIRGVKGVCYHERGRTVSTPPRPLIEPLDRIPLPDRTIVDAAYYFQPRQIIPYYSGRSATVMSSRGCPFKCTFCSTKTHWRKFRGFSTQRFIEEIEFLMESHGIEIIHIFDDLFIADRKRLREVHALVLAKGLNRKLKFMCLARADMINDEIMSLLKDMNVVVVGIGMESGCEETLRFLKNNANASVADNANAIELSERHRIPIMGSFMIGNPHESEEQLLETLSFIRSYRYSPYLAPLSYISTAFPGTEFWNYAKEKGIDLEHFGDITMDIPEQIEKLYQAPLLTEIPVPRFFRITQEFLKETRYQRVKMHLYVQPYNPFNIARAFLEGVLLEKSFMKGVLEVSVIMFSFFAIYLKGTFRRCYRAVCLEKE